MKKKILIALLFISALSFTPSQAFATNPPASSVPATTTPAPATPAAVPAPAPPDNNQCGFLNPSACAANLAYSLMSLVGTLLGLVATLFNWVMLVTVFKYAVYFGNSAGMLAAWGILRDVSNIIILFGFIYMGVLLVLDLHSMDARKALPRLIIFAILLNFSLFASEAIVDLANVLSSVIYTQAGSAAIGTSATAKTTTGTTGVVAGDSTTEIGIAGVIMHDTYIDSALSPTTLPKNDTNSLLAYIGTTIFMLVVLVLLLAACVMFFTRAIMLTILLVLSPLGFAGMAIPQFQGRASQWLQQLISNAFFAPIFLLLVFIGLKVMEAARTSLSGGAPISLATALSNPTVSSGSIFIIFGLTIGFMILALQYAKTSGVAGAAFATSFATNTVKKAVTAPARLAGAGARAAGGHAARMTIGKGAATFGTKYDATMGKWREHGNAFQKAAVGTLRFTGADEAIKDTSANVANQKFGLKRSHVEEEKYKDTRTNQLKHIAHTDHLKDVAQASLASGNYDGFERSAQEMSDDDLVKFLKTLSQDDRKKAGGLLSNSKLKKILEKEHENEIQADLLNGRFGDIDDVVERHVSDIRAGGAGNIAAVKDAVKKLTEKDFEVLATNKAELLDAIASVTDDASKGGNGESVIPEKIIDNLAKNDALTSRQRANVFAQKRIEQLKSTANPVVTINISKGMGAKEFAEVPVDILVKPEVAQTLNREKLIQIMTKGDLADPAKKQEILDNIQNYYLNGNFAKGTPESNQYEDLKKYLDNNQNAQSWWGGTLV